MCWALQPVITSDIFLDIEWDIEQEPDVAAWFDELDRAQFGHVAFHIDRLLVTGSMLRMPHSRALGDGLYELRFDLGTVSWRITYFFTEPRRIVLITVFRKTTEQQTPRGESCLRRQSTVHRRGPHRRRGLR